MTLNTDNAHIHLDIVGGIAGDMFISAMLDMCETLKVDVLAAVASVLPEDAGTVSLYKGLNSGISGLRFKLDAKVSDIKTEHEHTHSHEHAHSHKHSHSHEHSHEFRQKEALAHTHHHHTTYKYLCELMRQSSLTDEVTSVAIELLSIIARAEAKIHDKTLDDVHFHELADWDSLMDVVASAVILNALKHHRWSLSKLPLGGGLVNTQHGLIPVPAPATAEILVGFQFVDDGIQGERITPTGAAILRYLSDNSLLTGQPQGILQATGYGLGTKVFPGMPNILRAMLFDLNQTSTNQQDTVVLLEFDIDDMTGEEIALSLDLIREQHGVVDVVVQTARGKKNRAVELIRIMASTEHYQNIIKYCFLQTTTIGLRYRFETRNYLPRHHHEIDGNAYKSVDRPDGIETIKIEHDELMPLSTLNERRMKKYKLESSK